MIIVIGLVLVMVVLLMLVVWSALCISADSDQPRSTLRPAQSRGSAFAGASEIARRKRQPEHGIICTNVRQRATVLARKQHTTIDNVLRTSFKAYGN